MSDSTSETRSLGGQRKSSLPTEGSSEVSASERSHVADKPAEGEITFDPHAVSARARGGFMDKETAEAALATSLAASLARCAQRGVAAGRDMSGRRQLLGGYLRQWLDGKPDIKPAARHSYADHINGFLVPALGHLRLEDLAVSHIAAMYSELRQPRVKPRKPKTPKKA